VGGSNNNPKMGDYGNYAAAEVVEFSDKDAKKNSMASTLVGTEDKASMLKTYGVVSIVNLVIWVLMLTVTFLRTDSVRHFTYPMTNRFVIAPNSTAVAEAFARWEKSPGGATTPPANPATVYPFDATNRALLRDEILALGRCSPVASAGSSYAWTAQAVSPTCDCLDGMVATKIMAHIEVLGVARFVCQLSFNSPGKLTRSDWQGNYSRVAELEDLSVAAIAARTTPAKTDNTPASWDRCMRLSRATQVHSLPARVTRDRTKEEEEEIS
jgi:hypothetical protein